MPLAVLLLALAACRQQQASPPPRPDSAEADFEQGRELARQAHYDRARAAFEKAHARYEAEGDWERALSSRCRIGEIEIDSGRYDETLSLLTQALEMARAHLPQRSLAIAEAHQALGHACWRKGRYEDALSHLKRALATRIDALGEQSPEVASTYHHLGEVYQKQGEVELALRFHELALSIRTRVLGEKDAAVAESANSYAGDYWMRGEYDRALELCQRAASIWEATLGETHPKTAKAYGNIGILYAIKGDYDPAIAFGRKQLAIELATVGEAHPSVAKVRMNLGLTHRYKGENEAALSETRQAIAGFRATLGEDSPDVANAYINLGSVRNRMGDHEAAAADYERALGILRKRFGEKHPLVSEAYAGLGETRRLQHRYPDALSAHQKALSIRRSLSGDHHPEAAQCWNALALDAVDAGDLERAWGYLQQAIRANIPTLVDPDPYSNPPLINMLSEQELLVSLEQKGRILNRRFQKTGAGRDLEAAVASYRQAARLLDKMRSGYQAEDSKLFLSDRASGIYDDAIATARRLLVLSPGPESRDSVFLFAEKSRGGILLEALSDAEARQFAHIPRSVLDEERRLRADLAFYDRSVAALEQQGGSADKLQRAKDRRFESERQYEALLQRLEREHPDYYNLKYQIRTAAVEELQKELLDEDTTLLEYFLGRDSIVIFTLTRDAFDVTSVPRHPDLERQVDELRLAILQRDDDRYARIAATLYGSVVAPVAARLRHPNLIVVPDGVLCLVPFEALLAGPPAQSGADPARRSYLLERYAVSYAYSATLLLQTLKRQRTAARGDFLAFAPVFSEEGAAGAERLAGALPASRAEVTRIAELFRRRESAWDRLFGARTRVYLGREAAEDKLKSADLGAYRYVHFATHGLVDDVRPKLSGLRLAKAAASAEDGMLHLGEIYNLNLNAELVVLSACDTGLGPIARGEGLLGITRGFLYAGAANLVVSLWRVSDASTAEIMTSFYGRLLAGRSRAQALREAKLELMGRNPELARPYYWSAFTLIGR
jgi:CHAT domain-containing protein/lipopolysaccharide biosynthesis regulator YciM